MEKDDCDSNASTAPVSPSNVASSPAHGTSPVDQTLSDELKEKGNFAFAAGRFGLAVDFYTHALAASSSAALFANRAFAHLKSEAFGSAIVDADAALSIDPTFTKAYYRRGSALLALGRFRLAKRDFALVAKSRPTDKDAAAKLAECDKAIKRVAFEAAIATDATRPPSETLDPLVVQVPDSYTGPVLPRVPAAGQAASAEACAADADLVGKHGVSLRFVRALRDDFRSQRMIARRYAWEILIRINMLLRGLSSLVRAAHPPAARYFNVCGDTHGQFYDTCNIFELAGEPSPTNPFLFNGDYVDRGSFSVENVLVLFAWKLLYPEHVHLTRGNHETKNLNRVYGFEGEVRAKYDSQTMDLFTEVFQALPLAAVIDDRVFVTHGGLFCTDGVTLSDIEKIGR